MIITKNEDVRLPLSSYYNSGAWTLPASSSSSSSHCSRLPALNLKESSTRYSQEDFQVVLSLHSHFPSTLTSFMWNSFCFLLTVTVSVHMQSGQCWGVRSVQTCVQVKVCLHVSASLRAEQIHKSYSSVCAFMGNPDSHLCSSYGLFFSGPPPHPKCAQWLRRLLFMPE